MINLFNIFRKHRKHKEPEQYIEQDTICDKCKYLDECLKAGGLVEVTLDIDTRPHYIFGRGYICEGERKYKAPEIQRYCNEDGIDIGVFL